MITQYDMASCEMILDPETERREAAAVQDSVELRLQTLAEAIAIEAQANTGMPADLFNIDPAAFIASQK